MLNESHSLIRVFFKDFVVMDLNIVKTFSSKNPVLIVLTMLSSLYSLLILSYQKSVIKSIKDQTWFFHICFI